MNPGIQSIQWPAPGGLFIPEHELIVDHEPAILALRGGRCKTADILHFDPDNPVMTLRTRTQPEPFELSCAYLQWMRLINPVHLQRSGSREALAERDWQVMLKRVEVRFRSGDMLTGSAAALHRNDRGWFLFLVEGVGLVSRYFVPWRAVLALDVNGEPQQVPQPVAPAQRTMGQPRLAALLHDHPDLYPWALEAQFPRVLQRIMDAWDIPDKARRLFAELLVDVRGGRQGFPREVARDLFRLSETYDAHTEPVPVEGSPWEEGLAREGVADTIDYSPVAQIAAAEGVAPPRARTGGQPAPKTDDEAAAAPPLMAALMRGDEPAAEQWIQRGADVLYVDADGYMPLHWAAWHGMNHVVELLLQRRAPANAINRYGWTPLLQASAQGHAAVCELLIAAGARVAQADGEGWTALHKAAANGHRAVVDVLLRHGADVHARHVSGQTAAGLAMQHGFADICGALVQQYDPAARVPEDGAIDYRP